LILCFIDCSKNARSWICLCIRCTSLCDVQAQPSTRSPSGKGSRSGRRQDKAGAPGQHGRLHVQGYGAGCVHAHNAIPPKQSILGQRARRKHLRPSGRPRRSCERLLLELYDDKLNFLYFKKVHVLEKLHLQFHRL